ncbi:hypothetical protein GRH90_12280 [Enterobacteriales bacterium SAP-6]|uniref:Dermonecrotic toxin N-terminal domain-containing protein n=2 Tax=Acerihabitans arboris TaxID=2691583 RepID=A0A845SFB9_9GAMM|nr:hypothetical protein [Acerihabitans arboris]
MAISHEANRFSGKMGWGIPLAVFDSACSIYHVVKNRQDISTVLASSLPLCVNYMLSRSNHLFPLAGYLKEYIEGHLGPTLNGLLNYGTDRITTENGYLLLGVLALVSQYYCKGWDVPQPHRTSLKIPAMLAGVFTTACQCWQSLCAASAAQGEEQADDFGRIILNPMEKKQQAAGRLLARHWVRMHHNNQIEAERTAESYYAIGKVSGRDHAARDIIPPRPIRPGHHRAPPVSAGRRAAFTDLGDNSGWLPDYGLRLSPPYALESLRRSLSGFSLPHFSLPHFSLLPGAAAADIAPGKTRPTGIVTVKATGYPPRAAANDAGLNRYLRDAFPSLKNIVAARVKQQVKAKFGVELAVEKGWLHYFNTAYRDQESITGWSHIADITHSLTLADYILNHLFDKDYDEIHSVDRYAGLYYTDRPVPTFTHKPQVAVKPSQLVQLVNEMDIITPYLSALDAYWQHNHKQHNIANIINILTHLRAEQSQLTDRIIGIILHGLGLENEGGHQTTLHLFDINGYQATDMFVINVTGDNTVILYLPHGLRHFRIFDGVGGLRRWIIKHCKDPAQRKEIAIHFALRERMDGKSLFGKWGVDRWLAHIDDYPDRVMLLDQPVGGPLHAILGRRQRARAASDAEKLAQPCLQALWAVAKTIGNITDILYVNPLVPFSAAQPANDNKYTARHSPLYISRHAVPRGDTVSRALWILRATLGEILPRDDAGYAQPAANIKLSVNQFFHIANEDIKLWQTLPDATPGEERILAKLAVYPQGYTRRMMTNLLGKSQSHFTISLMLKNGRRRDDVTAIRIYHSVLPLRFNNKLKFYEVYDINHHPRPGYPVYMENINGSVHWQFGRVTDSRFKTVITNTVAMADYAFVSIRLFKHVMVNMDKLCCKGKSLSPINSLGIAQDAQRISYLKIGIHYIKIENLAQGGHYLLGFKDAYHLFIRFNDALKKFILSISNMEFFPQHPVPGGVNPALPAKTPVAPDYRRGYGGTPVLNDSLILTADKMMLNAGVTQIMVYGLSQQDIPANPPYNAMAMQLGDALISCRHILRDLLYAAERQEQQFLVDNLFSVLRAKDPDPETRRKAMDWFNKGLENTLDVIQRHIDERFSRIWVAQFDKPRIAVLALRADPLKRIIINGGHHGRASPQDKFNIHFCRYGCGELSPDQDFATLGQAVDGSGANGGEQYAARYNSVDFPSVIRRLWSGDMTQGEINFLISLPQAEQVKHYFLLTDRELAQQLFRKKVTARIAMITRNADLFCQLLAHLHQAMNAGHPFHRHNQDPWLMAMLFSAAFHALTPASPAR